MFSQVSEHQFFSLHSVFFGISISNMTFLVEVHIKNLFQSILYIRRVSVSFLSLEGMKNDPKKRDNSLGQCKPYYFCDYKADKKMRPAVRHCVGRNTVFTSAKTVRSKFFLSEF